VSTICLSDVMCHHTRPDFTGLPPIHLQTASNQDWRWEQPENEARNEVQPNFQKQKLAPQMAILTFIGVSTT